MENNKRLFLALAISVVFIFLYQSFIYKYYKRGTESQQPQKSIVSSEQATPLHRRPERLLSTTKPSTPEHLITIENDLYRIILTDRGAGIKEVYFLKFKDREGKPIRFAYTEEKYPPVLLTEDTMRQLEETNWRLSEEYQDYVVYVKEDENQKITKAFKFYNSNYIIELELTIQNKIDITQDIRYKIIGGSGVTAKGHIDKRYIGADVQIDNKINRRNPASRSIRDGEIFYGHPSWVSTRSRYFSFILQPKQLEKASFIQGIDKKSIYSGIILGPFTLGPKEELKHRYLLYAGPNNKDLIRELGPTAENAVSYGALSGIASVILKVLKFFYRISGNYGIAIILISLTISVVMFPLTRKSLRSMKEMQRLQPKIEEIKKVYKDNPQKMNKEVMELYKKHKVNPIGGCLPMFLQFPIFISLYQVLIRNVELKGAGFLWIKDMSEPDSAFILPTALPILGNSVNILPILMIVAMIIQQKLSQPKGTAVSEQQRIMSNIFPLFLGIIFYNLPSGLVLYWLTNTLIMVLLQEVALKSHQPEINH